MKRLADIAYFATEVRGGGARRAAKVAMRMCVCVCVCVCVCEREC
jgi:hypothetical protein